MRMKKYDITNFITAEYQRLVRYADRFVNKLTALDAEDVVHDVIVCLFARPSGTPPIDRLAAYLYRSIRNRVLDLYRTHQPMDSIDASLTAKGEVHLLNLLADAQSDVVIQVEQRQLQEQLYRAINNLPANEREVLLATEFAGRKFADLAREMNVPIGTLLTRKSRAVSRLKMTFLETTNEEDRS
jgi:RNA polymerase sigma factor (sigma-70 family)